MHLVHSILFEVCLVQACFVSCIATVFGSMSESIAKSGSEEAPSSTLMHDVCCLAPPPSCTSTPSLHTDPALATDSCVCLSVCLSVAPQAELQTSSSPSLLLQTGNRGERTSSPFWSLLANMATGLRTRTLLDCEEEGGVDSSILDLQREDTPTKEWNGIDNQFYACSCSIEV